MTSKISVWRASVYFFLTLQIRCDLMVRGTLSCSLASSKGAWGDSFCQEHCTTEEAILANMDEGGKESIEKQQILPVPTFHLPEEVQWSPAFPQRGSADIPKAIWLAVLPSYLQGSHSSLFQKKLCQTSHSLCMGLRARDLLLYLLFSPRFPRHQEFCEMKAHYKHLHSEGVLLIATRLPQ